MFLRALIPENTFFLPIVDWLFTIIVEGRSGVHEAFDAEFPRAEPLGVDYFCIARADLLDERGRLLELAWLERADSALGKIPLMFWLMVLMVLFIKLPPCTLWDIVADFIFL